MGANSSAHLNDASVGYGPPWVPGILRDKLRDPATVFEAFKALILFVQRMDRMGTVLFYLIALLQKFRKID
jgi:hypothetical protein